MNKRKIWMSPTPSEAAHDNTNAIHQICLRMAKHLPEFGYEVVENFAQADLRVCHAGQGSVGGNTDVAIFHGLYPTAQGFDGVYFAINSHVIQNLKTARQVIAPSEWIADTIRRDMHISPNIVPWGVDTEEWTPADHPHVYALWNKARVDLVSDPAPMLALAERAKNVPFLTTFGEGGPNVKTIGRQPYEVMKNHVRHAGVYLSTNVETFGLGILQACAAGVPILGFRQGAIAEYLTHGVNAFLAEPGDMDGLYAGLEYCLKYRKALGENARLLAQQFTWENTAQKMAQVFDLALQPRPALKVSVVIPCHNYGQYVSEAIESVLKQQAPFLFEIIVVLDRCTDDSPAVVGRYEPYGVIALEADNGNLSATRNTGIKAAQGEYIVCLDADDRLGNPAFLHTLADALDQDRTLGIAFTGIRIIDAAGNKGHLNNWPKGYDFDLQAKRQNQVPSCCMFRKEAWRRAGGFRPHFKYAEDAEFWLTVGAIGYKGRHVVQDGWFEYRLHNQSASRVHRTGEIPEPDWTEFHPWTKDGQRPFAADGQAPNGSWPVRFYHQPNVSVIIPVGVGHEETVKDTLHSVEGQSHRQWECIVVNDTDDHLELDGFPWAKVVNTLEFGAGAGVARNLGAAKARAPLLVFLDADDILKPDFLSQALRAYQQQGRYIYTDWMTDDGRGKVERHATLNYTYANLKAHPSLHLVTTLIPRRWFNAVGGFDETLTHSEDVDFYLKLYTKGYCGFRLPQPLVVYNLNAGQRRKIGETDKIQFKTLLQKRYGQYMESDQMCDCIDPPKGLPRVPPTPENVAEYSETYGKMVEIQLTSQFAGVSPTTFRGPATRVNYGRRAKGDIFHVWEADVLNSDRVFTVIPPTEPDPVITEINETVIPPAPVPVTEMVEPDETPELSDLSEAEAQVLADAAAHETLDQEWASVMAVDDEAVAEALERESDPVPTPTKTAVKRVAKKKSTTKRKTGK